jgi:hypothetical protein
MITKTEAKDWFNNFDKNELDRKDSRLCTYNHFLHYGVEKGYVENIPSKKLEEFINE